LTLHKLHQTQFPSWDRDGPDLTSRSSQRSRSSTQTLISRRQINILSKDEILIGRSRFLFTFYQFGE
jgi:hypothetical protein